MSRLDRPVSKRSFCAIMTLATVAAVFAFLFHVWLISAVQRWLGWAQ